MLAPCLNPFIALTLSSAGKLIFRSFRANEFTTAAKGPFKIVHAQADTEESWRLAIVAGLEQLRLRLGRASTVDPE